MALVRGRKIGFVFQSYQLIPTLTAEENVLLPMELAGRRRGGRGARAGTARARRPGRTLDHYPVQLSGRRAAARGAGARLRAAAAHPAGRRAHRQPGHRQRRACARPAAGDEPRGRHHAGAGDARAGTGGAAPTAASCCATADRSVEPSEAAGCRWRTAIRIAWRELRGVAREFLFVVLAVAVGVGSLTGVRGFSRSFPAACC